MSGVIFFRKCGASGCMCRAVVRLPRCRVECLMTGGNRFAPVDMFTCFLAFDNNPACFVSQKIHNWLPQVGRELLSADNWLPQVRGRLLSVDNWLPQVCRRLLSADNRAPQVGGRLLSADNRAPQVAGGFCRPTMSRCRLAGGFCRQITRCRRLASACCAFFTGQGGVARSSERRGAGG